MKEYYRKYLQPEYGEASPEAIIDEPQEMDYERPQECRTRLNYETITELTELYKPCFCYKKIMEISTVNTFIHKEDHDIPIRIYLPQTNKIHRVMLFIHGGGWCMNNLDVYDYVPRYLVKYGDILVITPDYRLAPEHKFPAGLEDSYDALVWTKDHCVEYGGDPNYISVCGDSAGGNFTAAISLMARDRKGPHIYKQLMYFPATIFGLDYRTESELRYGNGEYFLKINSETPNLFSYYFDNKEDELSPYASPLRATDLSNLPPAVFLSAECDPLLDQALMYAAKLQDFGNNVEYHIYKGMVHAFLNRPLQKTFESLNDVISAIKE